jgi:cell division protein FtsW
MGSAPFVKSGGQSNPSSVRLARVSNGDLILLAAVAALCIIGLLMVYSTSPLYSMAYYKSPAYVFDKQILFMVLGAAIAFFFSRLDYHVWRRVAIPLMVVAILLLFIVLLNADKVLGAVRSFASGSIQPSELAKLATIIYLAVWLESKQERLNEAQFGIIPLGAILGVVGGLILLEPDLSAAGTILILGILLFFLAGGDLKQFLVFLVVALLVGWIVVQFSSTGRTRMASYISGLKDPLNNSDQMVATLVSIVNGKWFGVGIGNSSNKFLSLPAAATDSIFAVIIEELGLLGAVGVIGLYGILLWRGYVTARHAPDPFGALLAGGLTFWILIEAAINMGVIVGLVPVAGNALPFISSGGSNLICVLSAVGILISISRQSGRKRPEAEVIQEERRSFSATADLRRRDRRRRLPRDVRA